MASSHTRRAAAIAKRESAAAEARIEDMKARSPRAMRIAGYPKTEKELIAWNIAQDQGLTWKRGNE